MEMIQLDDAVVKGSSNISLNKVKDDEGVYPLYSAKGFHKNISFFHQEEEYLAIIKDGAGIGRISIHPPKSSCVGTMQYLIPKEGFDIRFIRYCLLSIDFTKYSQGATIPHIYFKDYKSELIPKLSIEEQLAIVSKLDQTFEAIDQAIANTEKNIENIGVLKKEMNKTLLSSQSSKKNQIFPLSEIAQIINGYSFSSKDFDNDHPTKSIKITNVGVHSFVETSDSRLPASFFRTYQKFSAKEGDLVIALTRTIISSGLKVALVPKEYDGALLNQRVAIIRVNEAVLDKDLLFEYLSSDECISYVLRNVKSTMQPNLSIGSLKKMPVIVPSQNEQTKMKSQIKEVNKLSAELTDNLTNKLNTLRELKMSILERAFKGELV